MEQIFIIEDGTLTKYEADDYVEVVYTGAAYKTAQGYCFHSAGLTPCEL